jgi:SAM-dependent methyltransferase
VAGLSRLRLFYLLHLSKPASDRLVYREIRRKKARKVVEIGMGTGQRAVHTIELLKEFHAPGEIHYTGVDLFEARLIGDGPRLTLRDAHRLLKPTGARIQLVPGAAGEALSRVANALKDFDAVIISGEHSPEQLLRAWFYLPRMVHGETLFFQESLTSGGGAAMRLLDADEVARLSAQGQRRAA